VTPGVDVVANDGCPHRVLSYEHDPALGCYGLEAAEALGVEPDQVFKTLVVELVSSDDRQRDLAVAIVPVSAMLDLKAMAKAAGSKKAVMAEVARTERSSGYVVGGISPFGQKRRLPTFVDETIALWDEVLVSAGRRGLEIAIAPADLVRMLNATEAAIASH